jgi:hypothetical protein
MGLGMLEKGVLLEPLPQWFSKWGSHTRHISATWQSVRHVFHHHYFLRERGGGALILKLQYE